MSTISPRHDPVADDLSAPEPPAPGAWSPALGCPRGALVTGAARRIGRELATTLGRLGWHVAVHHRSSEDEARAVCAEIRAGGGRAETVAGDLGTEPAEVFSAARRAVGSIGLLVNNASLYEWDDLAAMGAADWMRHHTVNSLAPVLLTQSLAASLPARAGGIVVNIVDSRVLGSRSRHFSYTLSKSGLWSATRLLARELAPRVRVNAIGPGPTLPEANQDEALFQERCARLPLGRGTTPREIANTLCFLVATPSVTGQLIALDGGDHLAD